MVRARRPLPRLLRARGAPGRVRARWPPLRAEHAPVLGRSRPRGGGELSQRRAAASRRPPRGAHPVPGRRDARPARGGDAAPGRRGARGAEKALPAARRRGDRGRAALRRTRQGDAVSLRRRVDGVLATQADNGTQVRPPTSPSRRRNRRGRDAGHARLGATSSRWRRRQQSRATGPASTAEARDARLREAPESRVTRARARRRRARSSTCSCCAAAAPAAVIGTLGGVCLLRVRAPLEPGAGPRAADLAQAPDSKRGALCMHRCLESAARTSCPRRRTRRSGSGVARVRRAAGPRERASPTPRPSRSVGHRMRGLLTLDVGDRRGPPRGARRGRRRAGRRRPHDGAGRGRPGALPLVVGGGDLRARFGFGAPPRGP